MDTFGETFLLLAAVVSVILLCRGREPRRGFVGETKAGSKEQRTEDPASRPDVRESHARAAEAAESDEAPGRPDTPDFDPVGSPSPERARAMSVVVRGATFVAAPVLAVAGGFLVAENFSPGGGFPAGVVGLGVILLLYAAVGYQRISRAVRPSLFEVIELAGAAAIIVIELLGLVLDGSFTANWVHLAPPQTLRNGGVLQLFSISELIEVGTGLTIVVFSLLGMRHEWTSGDDES